MASKDGMAALASVLVTSFLLLGSVVAALDLSASKGLFVFSKDGSFGGIEATYQAVRALEVVEGETPSLPETCKWVAGQKKSELPSVNFFALKISATLNCKGAKKLAGEAETVFLAKAQDSTDLLPLYYSLVGLQFLKEKSWLTAPESKLEETLSGAFGKLKALHSSGGLFKYSASGSPSAKAGGLALEAVAALINLGVAPPSAELSAIKSAVMELFRASVDADGQQNFLPQEEADKKSGGVGPLPSTSAAIRGLIALYSEIKEPVPVADNVVALASALFENAHLVTSKVDAFYLLDALAVLNDNSALVLVTLALQSAAISSAKPLQLKLTSLLGAAVPNAEIEVDIGGKQKVLKAGADGVTFEAKEAAADAPMGPVFVSAKLKSVDAKYLLLKPLATNVQVKKSVQVKKAKLAVIDSDDSPPETELSLVFGDGKAPKTVSATHLQKLRLSFQLATDDSGTVYHPQQVFLTLTHEDSGTDHLFVVPHSKGKYSLDLDLLKQMAPFYYLSGSYTLQLSVGDARLDNSFVWTLAIADLDFPDAPDSAPRAPVKKALLSAKFGPQKEIQHLFRVPEKRPPLAVSYAFVALILLPLVGFIVGLHYIGVNFRAFPTEGLPAVSAVAFHLGIAAILILYVAFWVKVNLFTTLKVLLGLALLTAIPGRLTLVHLADTSAKQKTA
eukprot:TRINITY_DN38313_c0_g1_i1.p1 TRINITY_DN38313_c0_g1~~TRINITY_DN38313_c0_g1_i1.p1  ORF type:complete len:677 (+),score=155.40 TRINITY_DN38313_c0_g1_i1:117-2147(+)